MRHGRAKKNPPSKKVGGKVFALDYGRLMGDPISTPPQTGQDAESRSGEGYEYTDWYFSKKQL
jgi:hypothetical protein